MLVLYIYTDLNCIAMQLYSVPSHAPREILLSSSLVSTPISHLPLQLHSYPLPFPSQTALLDFNYTQLGGLVTSLK